jgi:hypothetical protein
MTVAIALALATLGGMTQIEMMPSLSCRPRWPRQVLLRVIALTVSLQSKHRGKEQAKMKHAKPVFIPHF